MMKAAFFDVDGTLSAPRYPDMQGHFQIGFSDEEWLAFCGRHPDSAYDDCAPLACVADYAAKLKEKGYRLFVLSASASEYESQAKRVFLDREYPALFEAYHFVSSSQEKIDWINRFCEENALPLSDSVLVDDTFELLLSAHNRGIGAVHVANIVAGNVPEQG